MAGIQGSVPQMGMEFNAKRRAVLDKHAGLTQQLAADVKAGRYPQPDLVVWPENASDIDPYANPNAYQEISAAVTRRPRPRSWARWCSTRTPDASATPSWCGSPA